MAEDKNWVDNTLGLWGFSDKLTRHLSGGAPEKSYFGGSQEALDQQREQLSGQAQAGVTGGLSMLGATSNAAGADRGAAYDMMGQGGTIGQMGLSQQNTALSALNRQAQMRTPSLAEAQMRAAQDQNARAMLSMAAQARGGNQAAAMRTANMMGSQNALMTNQQLGMLRAQEEAQRQQNILAAQQFSAQAYGQRAGLGFGMQAQGLGAAQNSTAQLGQVGGQMGQIGLGAQAAYNDMNKAQLEADRGNASAAAVAGSPAATFGTMLSGVTQLWGGGGQGGR